MAKKQATKIPKDFPLYARDNGQFAKRINGKLHYFGSVKDPDSALRKYNEQIEDLKAGRVPRDTSADDETTKTVLKMADSFMLSKDKMKQKGDLSVRTFTEYHSICKTIIDEFGKDRLLSDIRIEDFDKLRDRLAIGERGGNISAVRLGNLIRRVKTVFKFANESDMTERPIKFGPSFKGPSKKIIRRSRNNRGLRLFKASEIISMIDSSKPVMRAMILLGINCGLGNTDVAELPISAIDFETRWLNFPRPKTEIKRRCPIWQETVKALREAVDSRPTPKSKDLEGLAFITKYGAKFVRTDSKGGVNDSVYAEFAKLLRKMKIDRDNLGFYALRHTFNTVGTSARDPVALSSLMGHAAGGDDMAAAYRELIEDDQLKAVTDHVHAWLWPNAKKTTAEKPVKKTSVKKSK